MREARATCPQTRSIDAAECSNNGECRESSCPLEYCRSEWAGGQFRKALQQHTSRLLRLSDSVRRSEECDFAAILCWQQNRCPHGDQQPSVCLERVLGVRKVREIIC